MTYKMLAILFCCVVSVAHNELLAGHHHHHHSYSRPSTAEYERHFPRLYEKQGLSLEYQDISNPKFVVVVSGKKNEQRQRCIDSLRGQLHAPQVSIGQVRDLLLRDNFPEFVINKYLIYFVTNSRNQMIILDGNDFSWELKGDFEQAGFPLFHVSIDSPNIDSLPVDCELPERELGNSQTYRSIRFALEKRQNKTPIFNRAEKGSSEYNTIRNMIKNSMWKPYPPACYTKYSIILPGLYLGAHEALKCPELLQAVSSVVSVHPSATSPDDSRITWTYIPAEDDNSFPIINYFDCAFDAIDSAKDGVFVHCVAGYSRSTTIVIAYLMRKFDVSFEEAYRYVRTHRSVTRPNDGFCEQLRQYEKSLHHHR